jgi:uncharacterized membrane protein YidH (DUF202 family)
VPPVESAISRETAIGIAVTAIALVAMVFDHLLGDDPGLEDPIAFVVAAVLTIACAIIVFGIVVPRTKRNARPADRAATRGGVLAVVSVLSIALIWLGVTFPIAGGSLALGLLGREGSRRWLRSSQTGRRRLKRAQARAMWSGRRPAYPFSGGN